MNRITQVNEGESYGTLWVVQDIQTYRLTAELKSPYCGFEAWFSGIDDIENNRSQTNWVQAISLSVLHIISSECLAG